MSGHDVIGDLHGHAEQLHQLLDKLDYAEGNGFRHPDGRRAVFTGDFINRGSDDGEVLRVVRTMMESGAALAVLGNHEFHLLETILLEGEDIEPPEECRPHLDWLRSLPLSLETDALRVVHATWHPPSLKVVAGRTCQDENFLRASAAKGTPEHKAAQILLRGIKVPFPRDKTYRDRFGVARNKARIRWWLDPTGKSYADLLFPSYAGAPEYIGPPASSLMDVVPYSKKEKPVFLGHYCLPPSEPKTHGNVACVDGCVTCDKILWAYRHNGEQTLDPSHLIYAGPEA